MATNEADLNPVYLENTRAEQEQEDLKRAAQTDNVVRGVNGSLVPAARKLSGIATSSCSSRRCVRRLALWRMNSLNADLNPTRPPRAPRNRINSRFSRAAGAAARALRSGCVAPMC